MSDTNNLTSLGADGLRSGEDAVTPLSNTPTKVSEAAPVPVNHVPTRRLDFLRGIAAVYVVVGHARGHLFAGGSVLSERGDLTFLDKVQLALLQATSLGTEAVILFFVLSGFAMAHSMRYSHSIKTFYLKRALRIWPPYFLAVLLAFGVAQFILNSNEVNAITRQVQANEWGFAEFAMMSVYAGVDTELTAQFWSLPQEVIFYLLCPLLIATRVHVVTMWTVSLLLTIFGMFFLGIYENPTVGGGVIYRHFFNLLIFFMTGAMAYYYQDRIPKIGGKALLVFTAVSFVVIWYLKYHVFEGWNTVTSILTVPLALMLLKNVPAKIYEPRWTNWGDASYSIYIFHMQIIMMIAWLLAVFAGIEQRQMTSFWGWVLSVPPVLFICWLFYLVGEKQTNRALLSWRERERVARARRLEKASS